MIIKECNQNLLNQMLEKKKIAENLINQNLENEINFKNEVLSLSKYLESSPIISFCCEFSEYKDLKAYLNDYSDDHKKLKNNTINKKINFKHFLNKIEEDIKQNTTLIKFGDDLGDGFIIQDY